MLKRFSILDRYVFFEFFKAFLFSLFGLLLILLVGMALTTLKIETKQPRYHMYLFLLYSIPNIITFVLPMAIMFAVCFTTAQLTVSRELVAILSAGISFYRAVTPIWIFCGILSVSLFFFQNFVVTPSNALASEEESIFKKDTATIKDIVWQRNLRGKEGYYFIYYLEPKEKKIKGGFNYIQLSPEGKPIRMLQAGGGQYQPQTQEWKFVKVKQFIFDESLNLKKISEESEVIEKFPDPYDFFENPNRDASELNLIELWNEINRKVSLGFAATVYQVQFHYLISFPLLCLIVGVIASIAGAGGNHRSTGPLVRALLVSALTILAYYLGSGLSLNLGNNGVVYPWVAAWAPTLIFSGAAGFLVFRHNK